jgi:PKD repeat protein
LTYAAGPLPAGANFNAATREFVWRPLDEGSAGVTFTVTDPDGESDTMTVALTATNAAPTVDAGADQVVGLQDIDVDCDDHRKHHNDKPEAEVSIAAVFDDLGLSDTHTATINWGDGTSSTGKVVEPTATTDGSVKGKHTYTRAGDYTVTVTVRDDDGGVRSDTLTVKVRKPIEKKNFDSKKDEYKLTEDTVLAVNAAHGVLDNDRGPSGATLKARVVEGPEHGKLLFNADGSFTYVPDRNFHGKDSFWYEFTDGNNVSQAVEVKLNVKDDGNRHSPRCIDWDDDWNRSPWNDCFMPFGKRWR